MTVPDAWDECGGCGHDRDDHSPGDGLCNIQVQGIGYGRCDCPGFTEAPA